jgi:hypothetical protein
MKQQTTHARTVSVALWHNRTMPTDPLQAEVGELADCGMQVGGVHPVRVRVLSQRRPEHAVNHTLRSRATRARAGATHAG